MGRAAAAAGGLRVRRGGARVNSEAMLEAPLSSAGRARSPSSRLHSPASSYQQ